MSPCADQPAADLAAAPRAGAALRHAGGWLLIAALIGAPWAKAGLPIPALHAIQLTLGFAVLAWLGGTLLGRRWPAVPVVVVGASVALLAQGWWMTLNAHHIHSPALERIVPRDAPWPGAAGAFELIEARLTMLTVTALLGGLWLVSDLGRDPRWRRRLVRAMALCAASIAAVGLVQKLGGLDPTAWHPGRPPHSPLGPFEHHANAASFLNLALPLAGALALSTATPRCRPGEDTRAGMGRWLERCVWPAAVALIAAGAVATGSKAGIALAGLTGVLLAGWVVHRHVRRTGSWRGPAMAAGVAAVALAGVLSLGWPALVAGLERTRESMVSRTIVWRISAPMALDAGMLGVGPGSYKLTMPESEHFDPELYRHWIVTEHEPGTRVDPWSHAHQDYLQTTIEWGWLGAAMWAVLALGGFGRAAGRVLERIPARSGGTEGAGPVEADERTVAFGLLVGLGVLALHAAVDFPMQVPAIQLYAITCLALAWACPRTGRAPWTRPGA